MTLGERRQIHEDLLYIYNVSSKDSGTYICLAFNKYGKARKETTLTVSEGKNFIFFIIFLLLTNFEEMISKGCVWIG